ncbi:hypothetical protein [Peribacillus muralis]|uniref:hypothetical protein n=1 Tax=Peribacillus muralis TaxID=264697 RepID=UPI00366FE85F
MENRDAVLVIKDCIFESVLLGNNLGTTMKNLHYIDGFKKEDILKAYFEMKEAAEGGTEE